MATIHLAMLVHGRNVAAAAAQDALHTAQQFGGTKPSGEAAGQRTLDLFTAVQHFDVQVDRGDDVTSVTVKGDVTTPLSGFATDIEIHVTGPSERFYEESDR